MLKVLVVMFLLLTPIQVFAVEDGLILYLPFDGNINDASGKGNNGTLFGNEKFIDGKINKAMEFDGSTYIEIPDKPNSGFDNVPGLTIETWIKIDAHHDNGIVVKLTSSNAFWPCSYNFETWSDGLIYFDVGADIGKYTTSDYPLGQWFHLAGVFDGNAGEDRVYVNGELKSTTARPEKIVPDGDLPVYIGCVAPGTLYFKGALDDLAIYSRALSQTEILQDMQAIMSPVKVTGKLATSWSKIKAGE